MSHVLDLSGANEKLFFLRQLVTGSREYCKKEKLNKGSGDYVPEDWQHYWERLEYLVSKSLLDSATSLRVLQDTLSNRGTSEALKQVERDLGLDVTLESVLQGNFKLTVRESCNKIIHATSVWLETATNRSNAVPGRYNYWNGKCNLQGEHFKEQWHIRLDVYEWCDHVDAYFECMAGELEWW